MWMYLTGIPNSIPISSSIHSFMSLCSFSASYSFLLFIWLLSTSFLSDISLFCSALYVRILFSEAASDVELPNTSFISSLSFSSAFLFSSEIPDTANELVTFPNLSLISVSLPYCFNNISFFNSLSFTAFISVFIFSSNSFILLSIDSNFWFTS